MTSKPHPMNPATPHRIDVHHHFFPPGYVSALHRLGIVKTGGVPLPHWSADQTLALMDRQGIATSILSISAPGAYFGDVGLAQELARQCNEFSADLIKAYPGRFGAFAVLPLPDVGAALAELTHALDNLHLDGVVLMTNVEGRYLGEPVFDPILAELNRRRVPTFVHPTSTEDGAAGHSGSSSRVPYPFDSILLKFRKTAVVDLPVSMVDWPFDTTKAVAHLLVGGALKRFPHIPFILSHAGGAVPYLAWRLALFQERLDPQLSDIAIHGREMLTHKFSRGPLEESARGLDLLRRLYFDTAFSATPYVFGSLLALVDTSHILFGTDLGVAAEFVAAQTVRGIAEEPGISQDGRLAIERDSALSLFPRLRGVPVSPAGL